MRAKMSIYSSGISSSAAPFIDRFTPFGETSHARFLVKSISSIVLIAGIAAVSRRHQALIPVAIFFLLYLFIFMTSGGLIFPWYLTPATFAHDLLLAAGLTAALAWISSAVRKISLNALLPLMLTCITAVNIWTLAGRLDECREIQGFEEELRVEIGRWLRENTLDGSTVFLEPIGYIGYHAGPGVRIIDQMGLVSPAVSALRRGRSSWYIEAVRELRPGYIVEYTRSLDENIAEGTSSQLFRNSADRLWFDDNYETIRLFEARGAYPHIEEKEKSYTILKRRDLDRSEE